MSQPRRRSPRLLTAGYLTLDLIVRDLPTLDYWHSVGGTCGNVSVLMAAMGGRVSVLARVGEDQRGQRLLSKLAAAGVNTSGVERVARMRTPGIVELIRGGRREQHRFSFRCPLCGTQLPKAAVVSDEQAEAELAHIHEFDAFFFDRATAATVRLAEAARQANLLIVFEPTAVPRTDLAERAAALSDIVKVAQQAGDRMSAWKPTRGASTRFIIETLGSRGVRLRNRTTRTWSKWRELPAIEQHGVRDTAGAGDWLTVGLITACLASGGEIEVDDLQQALEYGQGLSAVSLAFDGPQGALKVLEPSAIARLARGAARTKTLPSFPTIVRVEKDMIQPADHCGLCLSPAPGAVAAK